MIIFCWKRIFLFGRAKIVDRYTSREFYAKYAQTYIPGSKVAVHFKKNTKRSIFREILNKTGPPRLLKNRYMVEMKVLVFNRYHFLFDIFDRKLQQYIEADLINFNINVLYENINPKKFEIIKDSFKVLTLGELEAGFVVCMLPLVFSILVFLIEWVPTLKDFSVFLSIFEIYFVMKKMEQEKYSRLMKIKITNLQRRKQELRQLNNIKVSSEWNKSGKN